MKLYVVIVLLFCTGSKHTLMAETEDLSSTLRDLAAALKNAKLDDSLNNIEIQIRDMAPLVEYQPLSDLLKCEPTQSAITRELESWKGLDFPIYLPR